MTDPSLNNRLRQRSRRAGLAVGLSMALTIALCIGASAWLYARIDPYLTDFVGAEAEAPTVTPTEPADDEGTPASGRGAGAEDEETPEPTRTPRPRATREPTPTEGAFQATHRSNPELSINFRPRPSTEGDPVAVLDGGTLLQFLGEEQTGDDQLQWFRFRTEDGTEGWLREGTFEPL